MNVELSGTVLGMELELERILEVDDEGTVVVEVVDDDELTQQVDDELVEHVDAGGDEEVLGTKTDVENVEAESEELELELVEEQELLA